MLYSYSKSKIDITYDEVFLINNETYYCSELIYEAFLKRFYFRTKTNDISYIQKLKTHLKFGKNIIQN